MTKRTNSRATRRPVTSPTVHTILFLAANPPGTDRLALDQEARDIELELERSGHRDQFELVTRWAVQPLDLLREIRRLKPTIVHFSGHGAGGMIPPDSGTRRDVIDTGRGGNDEPGQGLYFRGTDGRLQLVSTVALEQTFRAAGASVKIVVLNACYSEAQARALVAHVDCVIGVTGSIRDESARSFAIGFYGGLGEGEPVAAAFRQGCAAMCLDGLPGHARPQLRIRAGIDATGITLAGGSADERVQRGPPGVRFTAAYATSQVEPLRLRLEDPAVCYRPARPWDGSPAARAVVFLLAVLVLGIAGGTTWYGFALVVFGTPGNATP